MKYMVTGRVHPERADVSFSQQIWQTANSGSVTISCDSSQLTVLVDLPDIDGYVAAFIVAEHVAQSVVSSLGFALGTGYTVELIQLIEETGESHVFGARPDGLHFETSLTIFASTLDLIKQNLFFRLALRDYMHALTETVDCAFYCYRAIEAIKSSFDPKQGGKSWSKMHLVLGTSEDEIRRIVQDFAAPVRHGNWSGTHTTTSAQRYAMLKLTRDILAKFVTYQQNPGHNSD